MTNFIHDKEKMADFNKLTKEEFLKSYSYLTEKEYIATQLEQLRKQIENECISTGEILELQSLAKHIDKGDVLLLEWAGVCEHCNKQNCNCDDTLLCVQEDCKELQTIDGEYCDNHFNN